MHCCNKTEVVSSVSLAAHLFLSTNAVLALNVGLDATVHTQGMHQIKTEHLQISRLMNGLVSLMHIVHIYMH